MKLLEKGQRWSMEVKCTGKGNGGCGCGARLLIEKDDIYLTHHYDFSEEHEIFYTFKCIDCGAETDIKSEYVPVSIQKKLLEEYRNKQYVKRYGEKNEL